MEMFKSATRASLLLLILTLIGINVFALIMYPDTAFKDTFTVFTNIIVAVTSFFFGKSSQDSGKPVEKQETALDNYTV